MPPYGEELGLYREIRSKVSGLRFCGQDQASGVPNQALGCGNPDKAKGFGFSLGLGFGFSSLGLGFRMGFGFRIVFGLVIGFEFGSGSLPRYELAKLDLRRHWILPQAPRHGE